MSLLSKNFSYIIKSLLKSNRKLQILLIMPKNRGYITQLQKNRIRNRERKDQCSSGTAYLQFLGSGARGSPRSIYFFTDYGRYIFNCGEGTQRLAHEHKIKIARLEHVFITYPVWENIGGLPGLILTIQDCGVPDITIHGPYGINSVFDAAKKFINLNDLHIKMAECNSDAVYDDPAVTINYVILMKTPSSKETTVCDNVEETDSQISKILSEVKQLENNIDYYGYLKRNKRTEDVENIDKSDFSNFQRATFSMAYICKLKPKIGTLNLEACVEKGVPPGPLLGKLKAGIDVTLPDGTFVKAEEVKKPDEPGPVFIIIDCPSVEYLECLINEKKIKKHQAEALTKDDIAKYVIHFTPPDVMSNERYQMWIKRFPKETLHVNANESNTCLGSVAIHKLQYKLNLLDPVVFPLLRDKSVPTVNVSLFVPETVEDCLKTRSDRCLDPVIKKEDLNISEHIGHTLRCLDLRSSDYLDKNRPTCIYMNPKSFIEETMYKEGFSEELQSLKLKLNSLSQKIECDRQKQPYPIFTFLGTGSSVPNKSRNTSGILVSFKADEHMLLDCGEGTFNQFIRFFGNEKTDEILSHLKTIFISHLHADHHMGLIQLLKERKRVLKRLHRNMEKIVLFAPKEMMIWLCSYHQQFEDVLDCFELLPNHQYEVNNKNLVCFNSGSESSLKSIVTAYVPHCPQSFGISIVDSNNIKITYSGDCMPSDNLIKAGKKSDLLIHEATFEDELSHEAKVKMHSTTSQAIDIGRKMGAKFTILTHFSQRYSKIPVLNENFTDNVGIAFDNMQVAFSDFQKFSLFYPIFKSMFSEEQELLEIKSHKRKRTEEREFCSF